MPRRGLPETVRMRHDEHYVEALAASAGAPIGRQIPIDRIEGKFKLNQNRSREDQEGVAATLETSGDPTEREVARLMRANMERKSS